MNNQLIGKVISVGDGDTFRIITENGEKKTIRFSYIDAPELKQLSGKKSKQILQNHLPINSEVRIDIVGKDYYGRITGLVYRGEFLINLALVREGSVIIYRKYLSKKNPLYSMFTEQELCAKEEGLCFWEEENVEPWVYRKMLKEQQVLKKIKIPF